MFPCGWRFHCMPGESIAQSVKNPPAMQETQVRFLGWEDPLGKEVAIHSSILTWKIPWTEEPGGLQYMGSQESDMTEWLSAQHPQRAPGGTKAPRHLLVSCESSATFLCPSEGESATQRQRLGFPPTLRCKIRSTLSESHRKSRTGYMVVQVF